MTLTESLRDQLAAGGLDPDHVVDVVRRTLAEDLSWGPDVTTAATVGPDAVGTADLRSRQAGCLAGVGVAAAAFQLYAEQSGATVETSILLPDGTALEPGSVALTVTGPTNVILSAERTALNLVGQLSGVATATRAWVEALGDGGTRVRDTRKTVPGLRVLQKYAVRCGGGVNHRMGLGDAALIKDNHVAAAGSVAAAFTAVRAAAPQIAVEVECDTLTQVREAVDAGATLVLLDNMTPLEMREAVALCRPSGVATEASGGLTLADAAAVAATGVDYVAVGALTHSAPVLDLGLDLRAS